MTALVFLEHHGDQVLKGSLGVLAKAAALSGGEVAGVVMGSGIRSLAERAGKFGATKVYVAPSTDGGVTWPSITQMPAGGDQFNQWLAVDPTDGDLVGPQIPRRAGQ